MGDITHFINHGRLAEKVLTNRFFRGKLAFV